MHFEKRQCFIICFEHVTFENGTFKSDGIHTRMICSSRGVFIPWGIHPRGVFIPWGIIQWRGSRSYMAPKGKGLRQRLVTGADTADDVHDHGVACAVDHGTDESGGRRRSVKARLASENCTSEMQTVLKLI